MITSIDFNLLYWKTIDNSTMYPFIETETEYIPIKFYGLAESTDSYFSLQAVHAIRSNKAGVVPEMILFDLGSGLSDYTTGNFWPVAIDLKTVNNSVINIHPQQYLI